MGWTQRGSRAPIDQLLERLRCGLAQQEPQADKTSMTARMVLRGLPGIKGARRAPTRTPGMLPQQQRAGEGEVHVALGHVGEANDEGEDGGVGDVGADDDRGAIG
jgi:hypothetical protein